MADVLAVCPLLIPQNKEFTEYRGFIDCEDDLYQVHISLPSNGVIKDMVFDCDWKLQLLLNDYSEIIKKRLSQSRNLAAFLVELKNIIERCKPVDDRKVFQPTPSYYKTLLADIKDIGWEKLVYVDKDFKTVHFSGQDNGQRNHVIKITVDEQYPNSSPVIRTDLPAQFDTKLCFSNNQETGSVLKILYEHFLSILSDYSEFWDDMDEIDEKTVILEPENPSRCDVKRRISLGNSASLFINVNPKYPRLAPECKFLGADQVIQPLRESWFNNMTSWDPEYSILHNMKMMLRIEFTQPNKETMSQANTTECGICYAYRFESEIPDQVCPDERCQQAFHPTCLYEWLCALPDSRQSFNFVFGDCPYCTKPMSVKMPER